VALAISGQGQQHLGGAAGDRQAAAHQERVQRLSGDQPLRAQQVERRLGHRLPMSDPDQLPHARAGLIALPVQA
jgi:hypothetical protein